MRDPHTQVETSRAAATGAPVLHTAQEAAEILRVRQSWLERQAAARKVPFTMLSGGYRFTDGHLAEIVRIYEQSPAPAADTVPAPPSVRQNAGARGNAPTTIAPLRPRPRSGPRRVA